MWASLAIPRIVMRARKAVTLGLLLGLSASSALACDLRVLGPRVIWTVLNELGPSFERSAGCRLYVVSEIAVTLAERIEAGERFDVYAGPPVLVDRLVANGKLVPDSVVPLMRSGIERLIERLGLAQELQAKLVRPDTDIVSRLVAAGEIELGMVVISQILTSPGVELVGPLPAEIQTFISWSGGVSTTSPAPGAARELLRVLTSSSALPVLQTQGLEPGRRAP
jgi:molybdate transport system substrate-binding protein